MSASSLSARPAGRMCNHQPLQQQPLQQHDQRRRMTTITARRRASTSTTRRRGSTLASRASNTGSFDYTALVGAVTEIKSLATPAKVDVAAQPDAHTLVLGMRGMDGKRSVRVSWHPEAAYVAMSASPPRLGKDEQLSFGEAANAILRGKVLLDARAHAAWERVCRLSFGDRPGGEVSHEILCEVMGRYSNAFLLDANGDEVLACGYQVGEKQTSVRRLAIGYPYSPPPPAPGIDPDSVDDGVNAWKDLLVRVAGTTDDGEESEVHRCLVRAFRGVSPTLAKSLIRCAGLENGVRISGVSDGDWSALYDEFQRWMRSVKSPSIDDASWCEDFGQLLLHSSTATSPLPPAGDLSESGGPIGTLFGAVFGEAGEKDVFDRERARILQSVRARLKKLESKGAGFVKQLEAASGHEEIQARADALMAYVYNYKPGARELETQDFNTGETVMIPVDPEKGPVGTAEAMYKKTRKLRRTADAVEPLIAQNAQEIEYLQQVEFSIVDVPEFTSRDDLLFIEEIGAELVDGGFMKPIGKGADAKIKAQQRGAKNKKQPKSAKAARKQEMMSAIRIYTAPSGREVYCGRNSRGNEAVSLHFGQDQDVWFHVRGAPGAHVILRLQPGETPSDEDMQFAANIASFHSKVRTGGKVNVSYTSPKYVQKPKGARLGMVTIDRESVMIGRPDDVADVADASSST